MRDKRRYSPEETVRFINEYSKLRSAFWSFENLGTTSAKRLREALELYKKNVPENIRSRLFLGDGIEKLVDRRRTR